jgi:tRNA wybutosine-synthesizing protein 2
MGSTLSRASVLRDSIKGGEELAALVSKGDARNAIKEFSASGLIDLRRKILTRQRLVEIPVKDSLPGYQMIYQEQPEFFKRTPELAELLKGKMDSNQLKFLPRGWFILGNVIIVKIQPQIEHFKYQIGEALLSIYPRCRSVLRDFGIEGSLREPVREIISGDTSETIHRENGVLFKLDAIRIMFSQGNLRERIRMSRLGQGDVVVDMFAGIGYFTIPMAVHARPKKILAIELNPIAYRYLVENIMLNHVQSIVNPVLGDCSIETPCGIADRVVMGYVGTTNRYLKMGIKALRPGGVLHYHQTIPSWQFPEAAVVDVAQAAAQLGLKAEILCCARVKKYSPGVVHAVVDARIGKDF